MAQRVKQTAKKAATRPESVATVRRTGESVAGTSPAAAAKGRKRTGPPLQRAATVDRSSPLERERDDLKIALEAAMARIRALEEAQAQVANRIGWMIEALQTLRDEGR